MKTTRNLNRFSAALLVLAGVAMPAPNLAQTGVWSSRCEDPGAGTLGIQGLRCEGCSFSMGRSGITEATFGTEPEVLVVDPEGARGDALEAGDVLVAIDGDLITTRRGGQRLASIHMGDEVTLRVRRDGRLRDLKLTAGSACESAARNPAPLPPEPTLPPLREVEPPTPLGIGIPQAAEPPPLPQAQPEPGAWVRPPEAPPAPPALEPRVTLGFSFECGGCGFRSTGVGRGEWHFEEPPVVYRVDRTGPAWRGGLRQGDQLLAIDRLSLTSREGARRFTDIAPLQEVVWSVRRDGQVHEVTTVPGAPGGVVPPEAPAPGADRLRFTGQIGEADVEVRGAPVTVAVDRERGVMTITSADLVIYVRVPTGGSGVGPGRLP